MSTDIHPSARFPSRRSASASWCYMVTEAHLCHITNLLYASFHSASVCHCCVAWRSDAPVGFIYIFKVQSRRLASVFQRRV
jgi:hypothetical protein